MVDLQASKGFQALGVELLSISPDQVEAWRQEAAAFGITAPVLFDSGNSVAEAYGVMQWSMPSNEPGHSFVLIDRDGKVTWIRDYGAPENGGAMYVLPSEIVLEVAKRLEA